MKNMLWRECGLVSARLMLSMSIVKWIIQAAREDLHVPVDKNISDGFQRRTNAEIHLKKAEFIN